MAASASITAAQVIAQLADITARLADHDAKMTYLYDHVTKTEDQISQMLLQSHGGQHGRTKHMVDLKNLNPEKI